MKIRGNTVATPLPGDVYNVNLIDNGTNIDKPFDEVKNAFQSGKVVTLTQTTDEAVCRYLCFAYAGYEPAPDLGMAQFLVFGSTGNDGTHIVQLIDWDGVSVETKYFPFGGGSVELDTTLTQEGKAADAKAVGDAISGVKASLTSEEKTLMLSLFRDATYTKNVYSTLEQLATLWGMEIPWVKVIPVEELMSGYGLASWKNTVNGETKYTQTSTTRTSYLEFIEIEPGATYKFEWDGPVGRQICLEVYNTQAMTAVAGLSNFSDSDRWSSGWSESQTTGCQFTIPAEINGMPALTMRFTFNSTSGPTGDVTITKVVV